MTSPACRVCVRYLQEVFDFRVVVGFLLNQRGAVELTRTEPAHGKSVSRRQEGGKDHPRILGMEQT